jgi:outer membrane protein insertion porin family
MLKSFFILIFVNFFLFLNSTVFAKIEEIVINGNERVNNETVIIFSKFKIGQNIDDNQLNEILKNLYETNFFKDIQLEVQNNSTLIITVEENPIIQNLIFNGIENQNLKNELLNIFKLKEKNPYNEIILQSEVNKLENLLQETGFYFSSINVLKEDNDNNTINLILEFDLGNKAYINNIDFIGNKKFKKNKLLNVITSEENKFWKFLSSKKVINKQRIDLDKRLLTNFYRNKGYYDVIILDEIIQYENNKNFNLVFNIDSGNKYKFGNFDLNIPTEFEKSYFEDFKNKVSNFSGEYYSLRIIEKMLDEIEKIASSKNYEFINASVTENRRDEFLDIKIDIIEDAAKFYVKKINILGNNITIEDVIRNELEIDEGDPFNNILFQKSINNIKSINIFKNVSAEVIDSDIENEKIINLTVEEKPTGQISAGAGVGSSGASTSFGIKESNFLGKGIILDTNLLLSQESIRGIFSYTRPNYKNSDNDLILSVQSQETDRIKNFGYKSSNTGFSAGTSFEQYEDFFISPSFGLDYETLTTSSSASSLLKKQEGDYLDITGSYSLTYDKRNQKFQPSDGFVSSFSQTLPINIEDNQTVVNSYEFKKYFEYIENQIFDISLLLKSSTSFGDEDVKISKRLYIPASKLRGFERGKVGPVDGDDFVGGNYLTAVNASSDLPIFQSLQTIDFNIFLDAANLWGVDYDSSINDGSKIRSSTGLGVDWYTPIGPLSFSFSQPLTKNSSDKTETFRFNLGTTF